jgi:hypothetical protein
VKYWIEKIRENGKAELEKMVRAGGFEPLIRVFSSLLIIAFLHT